MSNTPSVYVFNATPNKVGLILNGYPILTAISGVASSNSYAPNSTTVARSSSVGDPGQALFGGTNKLTVYYPSGGGQPMNYQVNIDSQQVPMTQDLQLYIFFSELVLVTTTGQGNLPQGQSQVLKGSPAPESDVLMVANIEGGEGGGGSEAGGSGGGYGSQQQSSGEGS